MRTFMAPDDIENQSMTIIEKELTDFSCSLGERQVVKRIIHTTVDVEFGKSTIFHPRALAAGIEAIKSGKNIITDVHMVKSGIRSYELARFGNQVLCFLAKDKTVLTHQECYLPRVVLGVRRAIKELAGSIIAIGNAPTALFEVIDLIKAGKISPALVIGVPVGFVGAVESKQELLQVDTPYITHQTRKGGSAVASAIDNALIKLALKEEKNSNE